MASAFALWAHQTILRHLPATSTNLSLTAVPVVGLVSSMIALDESITVAAIIGFAAIAAGVSINVLSDRSSSGPNLDARHHVP